MSAGGATPRNLDEASNTSMLGGAAECSMDYSVFRKNLVKQDRAFANSPRTTTNTLNIHNCQQQPLNTVKVRRISANDGEELKQGGTQCAANSKQDQNDYLLNYTFDLSLDDHYRGDESKCKYVNNSSGDKNSSLFGDELNETADQMDNLLEELNELVARRNNS